MAALPAEPAEEFKLLAEPAAPTEEPRATRPADHRRESLRARSEGKEERTSSSRSRPSRAEGYELPSLSLLDEIDLSQREAANPDELLAVQQKIVDTLAQFSIGASPG
jgi:hypothetical protein